jgi:hypothetical protein
MMEHLQYLATSDRPWVAQRAQWALHLAQQHANGEISESEFQELMADLVRTDQLEAEADDLELKNALVTSIMILGRLA